VDDVLLPGSIAEHSFLDPFSAGDLFNKDDAMAVMTAKLTALKAKELDDPLKEDADWRDVGGSCTGRCIHNRMM
jgi:hypothetical protein